jgi:hypothetical protein
VQNDAATIAFRFLLKMQLGLRMRPSVIVAVTGHDAERYTHAQTQQQQRDEEDECDHGDLTPQET